MSSTPSQSSPTAYTIRLAHHTDVPNLAAIERSAGQLFKTVGLDAVADDDPMPAEVLSSYLDAGNLWVAALDSDFNEVIAFLAVFPITKTGPTRSFDRTFLHIAELSVHADHQRKGIAKALLRHLDEVAKNKEGAKVVGLSLTTYRDVAFNGPFYARSGFVEIRVDEIENVVGRRGRELWEEEQGKIVAKERRCWMVKKLYG